MNNESTICNNKSCKSKKYKEQLNENGIELLTIKDLETKINIEENGKNANHKFIMFYGIFLGIFKITR